MQQLSALFFGSFGNSALRTTCVLFLALFAHRFARKGLHRLIQKNVLSHHSKALLTNLLSAFIFGLTTLIVLEQFGISVVPLVTAFGISGFALALGLTDTVSNFFAGMNLLATRVIKLGDTIKLNTGEMGIVRDIRWRATHIHTAENNVTIIPNTQLVNAIVTNYSHPNPAIEIDVPFFVPLGCDLDEVRKCSQEIWAEIAPDHSQQSVHENESIRTTHWSERGVTLTAHFHVNDLIERDTVSSQFLTALYRALRAKGIWVEFGKN